MKAWIGKWLVGVAMIHTILGLVFGRRTLGVLVAEGLFNTVNGQPNREAVFWFLFTGFVLLVLGVLVDHVEKTQGVLPPFLAWSVLALCAVGLILMPISGIWLLLVPVVGLFLKSRAHNGEPPETGS